MAEDYPSLDPLITIHQVLTDLLTYLVHANERKPADPEAWAAVQRLDSTRRDLERALGGDPTDLKDPHGRMPAAPKKEAK